jgi:glycopeptide antibiotics resistance protein
MKKRLIPGFILLAYSAILIKVMVFKDVPMIRVGAVMINFGGSQATGPANLIPFKTILLYLQGEKGLVIGGINLLGNIILLVPVGILFPLAFRQTTWKKTLMLAVAAGFAIEVIQVVLRVGIFDIDDVILNAVGVLTGYWFFTFLARKAHSLRSKHMIKVAALTIVVAFTAVFLFFAVYDSSHLPLGFGPAAGNRLPEGSRGIAGAISGAGDPCNGTGGTGKIIVVGSHVITIKRHDGVNEVLKLTDKTIIRDSKGPVSESSLKPGAGVTVVVMSERDEDRYATAVLICNPGT